jgi:two-component system NtrC family sensor kinase
MPDGGRLTIATSFVPERNAARVSVADTGRGIPQDEIDKVFDPFFTTKEPGKGTGLGLSVSHGIVEQHKGRIDVSSSPGKGTAFTVEMPAAGPRSAREDGAAPAAPTAPRDSRPPEDALTQEREP